MSPLPLRAEIWKDAASQLWPSKTIDRIRDDAKFVAGGTSVISAALTGIGLATAAQLRLNAVALAFAMAAVVLGVASAALAYWSLILRIRSIQVGNLKAVEKYYKEVLRKSWIITLAGVLLLAALLAAAAASMVTLVSTSGLRPTLAVQVEQGTTTAMINGDLSIVGLAPGTRVRAQLVGVTAAGATTTVMSTVCTADGTGTVTVTADVPDEGYSRVRMQYEIVGGSAGRLEAPIPSS